jgi:glutamate/tyrosine decarboxylase-like PLP-dependent enzyme
VIAFGLNVRLLNKNDTSLDVKHLVEGASGIELADSITGDAHKLLNVPYDAGYFFSKHPDIALSVFMNAGAPYLETPGNDTIASPLNMGLENSRRFRALPVYASLYAYGVDAHQDMLRRQIIASRQIATIIDAHSAYERLPPGASLEKVYIIVLFRAKNDNLNQNLTQLINQSGIMYVSGSKWDSKPATRIAVSNWQVGDGKEAAIVENVLNRISHDFGDSSKN